MDKKRLPIGFLDSGVGGISVLARAVELMPQEHFIYYSDLGHVPYGVRSQDEIVRLASVALKKLRELHGDVKALVVSCNTITAAIVGQLQDRLPMPVIGLEPALQPAVEAYEEGKILVIGTPATLQLPRFAHWVRDLKAADKLIAQPCPGLYKLVEDCGPESDEVRNYMDELLKAVDLSEVHQVVLGCSYAAQLRPVVQALLPEVTIYDSVEHTAQALVQALETEGLMRKPGRQGTVLLQNSSDQGKSRELMERFYAEASEALKAQK